MKTIASLLTVTMLAAGCGQAASGGGEKTAPPVSVSPDVPVATTQTPGSDGRVMAPFTPSWVQPHPGGGPLTPVSPSGLRVGVRDGAPYAVVRWWSGIAPCSVLRSVNVGIDGATLRLRLVEGSDDPDAACPELAMLKATRVDLGSLEPGTYTVVAGREHRTLTV
jgi:hypothetical protein